MYLSMNYLDLLIVIRKEWRGQYMEFLGAQNAPGLVKLFKASLEIERNRINEF